MAGLSPLGARMIDVTVLFLDETFSSTAIGPMEVFLHAGELWNVLTGKHPDPPFRVTTASVGGRPVKCDGGLRIRTQAALTDIRKSDLIFIPSTGPSLDDVVERNARAFSQSFFRWYNEEHRHSGIGLLTPATVHCGQAENVLRQRQEVLDVAYRLHPERFVRSAPKPPALPSEVWINKPVSTPAPLSV